MCVIRCASLTSRKYRNQNVDIKVGNIQRCLSHQDIVHCNHGEHPVVLQISNGDQALRDLKTLRQACTLSRNLELIFLIILRTNCYGRGSIAGRLPIAGRHGKCHLPHNFRSFAKFSTKRKVNSLILNLCSAIVQPSVFLVFSMLMTYLLFGVTVVS